jgi:hypothetical protein
MEPPLPQKWWWNNFITCLSLWGSNGCTYPKKHWNRWGGTRKKNVIVKTLILCNILLIVRLGRHWTALIQNLQGTPGESALACRRMVSNLTVMPAVCILVGQFLSCLRICHPTNIWTKVLYSLPLSFRILRNRRSKWMYFCVCWWKRWKNCGKG